MSETPNSPESPNPSNPDPTTPPGSTPSEPIADASDVEKNKIMAILAYIGILVLIPILAAKDSKFARYHANQGLILFIAGFVGSIAVGILSGVILGASMVIHFLGYLSCCLWILWPCISFGWLALAILGIVNAANGKMKPLPLIGGYTILK
jgi:uncharacterized membrane protein